MELFHSCVRSFLLGTAELTGNFHLFGKRLIQAAKNRRKFKTVNYKSPAEGLNTSLTRVLFKCRNVSPRKALEIRWPQYNKNFQVYMPWIWFISKKRNCRNLQQTSTLPNSTPLSIYEFRFYSMNKVTIYIQFQYLRGYIFAQSMRNHERTFIAKRCGRLILSTL